jgi:hypothetical protein
MEAYFGQWRFEKLFKCVIIWSKHKILFHIWKNLFILGLDLDLDLDQESERIPHSSKSLDPDPHIMNAGPKHGGT